MKFKDTLIIEPDKGEHGRVPHTFVSGGHECPSCGGYKGHYNEISRNEREFLPCTFCKGTGIVRAIITVKWEADEGNYLPRHLYPNVKL
jgi:hypothetical protein